MLPDYLVNLLCMSCVFLKGLQNASKTIKIAITFQAYMTGDVMTIFGF